ncbi:MAG TPA: hypothetical protein VLY03_11815 [Bacteroidota bacterium]|nr:hypothetical protein [Bacteroidota bacterium]
MKSPPSDKQYPIVPPEELRCVWMSAGVLSYQLCDREFDCDRCPVDAGIKKQQPRHQEKKAGPALRTATLADGLFYTKNHCWIRQVDDERIEVGIEPGLAAMFHLPKSVILPSPGAHLRSNETCSWIVLEGGALPFSSPVDGMVLEVNRRVVDNPVLLSHQHQDECWLFRLKVAPLTVRSGGFWNKERATQEYASDLGELKELLARATRTSRSESGKTLADGGELLQTVLDKLGSREYFFVLRNFIVKKSK